MPDWNGLGRTIILAGIVLALIGVLVLLVGKAQGPGGGGGLGWLGKLPGDIYIKRDNFSFYAPIATGLVISIAVSLLLYLLAFLWRR